MCTSPSTHPTEEGTTKREAHGTKLVALRDSLRARRAECPTRTRVANISGPSSHRSSVPHRFGVAYDANPSGFQTQRFRSEGCSRLWSRSRSGPCPPCPHQYGWGPRPRRRTSERTVACVPRRECGVVARVRVLSQKDLLASGVRWEWALHKCGLCPRDYEAAQGIRAA
jgi:hypothetical protein